MKRTYRLATTVGAASALVLSGPATLAAPPERGVDVVDETWVDSCGEYDVSTHEAGTVAYRLRQRPNGDLYWSGHADIRSTFTNLGTGRSWTATTAFHEHDTRVLERDGTLVTMLVTISFRFTVYDEQGVRDSTNRGLNQFTLLIDTKGTLDPSDDTADFDELLKSVGSFRVGDFCDDADRFTTG